MKNVAFPYQTLLKPGSLCTPDPNIHPVLTGVDLELGSEEEIRSSSKIMDEELKIHFQN